MAEPTGLLIEEKVKEEVSSDRQAAFDIWEQAAAMGEYDPDGAVANWMSTRPDDASLKEWEEKGYETYYVVFPDTDGSFNPDVDVFICRKLLYKESKALAMKGGMQNTTMEQIVLKCTLFPKLTLSLINGNYPSGYIFTLYKRIQEASGWQDAALISKN